MGGYLSSLVSIPANICHVQALRIQPRAFTLYNPPSGSSNGLITRTPYSAVIAPTHFIPMARIKLSAETRKKRPRQTIVEAERHHSMTGIMARLQHIHTQQYDQEQNSASVC